MEKRCECKTASGKRCTRTVEIGLDFCWQHLKCKVPYPALTATNPKGLPPFGGKGRVRSGDKVIKPIKAVKTVKIAPKKVVKTAKPRIQRNPRFAKQNAPKRSITKKSKPLKDVKKPSKVTKHTFPKHQIELKAALTEFNKSHLVAVTKLHDSEFNIDASTIKFLGIIAKKLIEHLYSGHESLKSIREKTIKLFDEYWGPTIDKTVMVAINKHVTNTNDNENAVLYYAIRVTREYISDIIKLSIYRARDSIKSTTITKEDILDVLKKDYGTGLVFKKL